MKLLQQLFGVNGLSWFGRSRTKVTDTGDANKNGSSIGAEAGSKTTSVACRSSTCVQSPVAVDSDAVTSCVSESDELKVTTRSTSGCWSPTTNRICWGSPAARRSAARRRVIDDAPTADDILPRSRSLIRTNPWLPLSSPSPDRRHSGLRRSPSPVSGSGSASCPSTPADSPADSVRRWRLAADAVNGQDRKARGGTTTVASEGYYSISSLCTMSDSTAMSTAVCSDDMQMSVDSLASLFPTLTSSSTSFDDDKTGGVGFSDSILDSGIVISTTPIIDVDSASVSTVYDTGVEHKEDFDMVIRRSTSSDRSSTNCGTPTNHCKAAVPASASTLKKHLSAVQAALEGASSTDHEFDSDVFPFDERQQSAAAIPTKYGQRQADRGYTQPSRGVDDISTSLASSVERLRRSRIAVEGAFGRALAEDRRRQHELERLRRRMVEAQRNVLLATLRDLRRELNDQCRRLQVAYDAVLTARWPRLHAETAYTSSPSILSPPSVCLTNI